MESKLELRWVGKDKKIDLEPRILVKDSAKSFSYRASDDKNQLRERGGNLLIHGDNLLALKALETKFSGLIKCIYIDPPYNTGSAFSTYDDNLEHSTWLALMKPRIELLRKLLTEDGSLWISIDDDERDYLKILCDELFGRNNFVTAVIWQKKTTRSNDATWFSDTHDYILVYAKNKEVWRPNLLARPKEAKGYSNPDNDPRGVWASGPCHAKTPSEKMIYPITTPSGRVVMPPAGTSWRFNQNRMSELIKDNHIYYGPKGDNVPRYKRFLYEVRDGFVPTTLWLKEEVGDNQEAKKEVKAFNKEVVFSTPKPELLIKRVLDLATKPGDWVLDSFLGSGTTAAVAQKMGRHWIGIELTDVAYTHDIPRLKAVISGEDKGGITKETGYEGGGGFDFYELAPSLIQFDQFEEPIINKKYNADMLASAVALHEGFAYCPDKECFWKQSRSTENAYLFVTTMHVTSAVLDTIANQMRPEEFLIIACKTFDPECDGLYKNITIKKIPEMLLGRCEFGKDNYDLNIVNPPVYVEDEDDDQE